MTKTIWMPILTVAAVLVVGILAANPFALATEDGEDQEISFSWTSDDASPDPNHLIVIGGSFTRIGLNQERTVDVEGQFETILKGDSENNSEKIVTTTAGDASITTIVNAKSQDADDLEGHIQIDGKSYETKLSLLQSKVTTLDVDEEFTSPDRTQTLEQDKITIPFTIEMCDEDDNCFEGFGVLRRESSKSTTDDGPSVTFVTDKLEAEVISEEGLFELKLTRSERIVETT